MQPQNGGQADCRLSIGGQGQFLKPGIDLTGVPRLISGGIHDVTERGGTEFFRQQIRLLHQFARPLKSLNQDPGHIQFLRPLAWKQKSHPRGGDRIAQPDTFRLVLK